MNNNTTVEQSKKLLELGIKPETADMIHYYLSNNNPSSLIAIDKEIAKKNFHLTDSQITYVTPCWSLAKLFSMIPPEISDGDNKSYFRKYDSGNVGYEGNYLTVVTYNIFDLIVWLIQHNFIDDYCIKKINEYYTYTYSCFNKNILSMINSFVKNHEKDGVLISHYIEEGTNKDYLFNTNNISIKLYVPNTQNLMKEIEENDYLNQWIDTGYIDVEIFAATQIIETQVVENNRKTRAFINNILMINEDFYNKIFNE